MSGMTPTLAMRMKYWSMTSVCTTHYGLLLGLLCSKAVILFQGIHPTILASILGIQYFQISLSSLDSHHVVVLHADHDKLLYSKPCSISDCGKDGFSYRISRGPCKANKNKIRVSRIWLNESILQGWKWFFLQLIILYQRLPQDSKSATFSRMHAFMESQTNTKAFTMSNNEGVQRVIDSDGQYAFLMESNSIQYQIERNCELIQVGKLLDSKGYGIAFTPGLPYQYLKTTFVDHLSRLTIPCTNLQCNLAATRGREAACS